MIERRETKQNREKEIGDRRTEIKKKERETQQKRKKENIGEEKNNNISLSGLSLCHLKQHHCHHNTATLNDYIANTIARPASLFSPSSFFFFFSGHPSLFTLHVNSGELLTIIWADLGPTQIKMVRSGPVQSKTIPKILSKIFMIFPYIYQFQLILVCIFIL